jgi:hypothetical protein
MKTGRVRKKAQPTPVPEKEAPSAKPPAPKPGSKRPAGISVRPGSPARKPISPALFFGILFGGGAIVVLIMILLTSKGRADEWVEVTRASGEWTATLTLFGPQVKVEGRWESDCASDPSGAVQVGTCIMKDIETYQDNRIREYEEFAYDIYYEETWQKTYQAQGTEFSETALGKDDWWEENLHYVLVEELDTDSCVYTDYAIWVDDPQDAMQEIEVYLAQCEVWDFVTVYERVYDQKPWCQCNVTTLVELGQQTEHGSGSAIRWPNPNVPPGGHTERSFVGRVTFLGDDYTYTTTTEDTAQYQGYLTDPYYIGIRDGKPVSISKSPPQK